MGHIETIVVLLVASLCCAVALPRTRVGVKDVQNKRVKRDDDESDSQNDEVTVKTSSNGVELTSAFNDSESNNLVSDNSYEQQQDDGDLGDMVANLPMAGDDGEDDDVDLTLYPQGWNDQTLDDGDDGQVYERRKRNVAAAINLSQQRQHNKNKHSSRTARKQLERARHPVQTAAKKNRTKRGAPSHPQQQSLSDEDLLSLILLADQMQARKQQYRDQYAHQRRPMVSDEDPLLTAALLAAQAEDEEGILDAYQPDEDDDVYMPVSHGRGRMGPMYSPKVYQDQYMPIEFTDNGYRRSGSYRQPYLPGQKRSSRNTENDKLYAIAQMLGKPHEQNLVYRRQRA